MKSKNLLDQLKELPYFRKNSICLLGKHMGLNDKTVNTYISRFLRERKIYRLKNGLYVSADFFDKNKGDISYSFYLANILRTPSYVSSWTALQYYGLTTEAIYSISSVTTKVTREYKTNIGHFTYQSIHKDLFSDFSLIGERFDFFIASPSKALFDLLYFRTNQFKGANIKNIESIIEDLRIDVDEMSTEELSKFYKMIKQNVHE